MKESVAKEDKLTHRVRRGSKQFDKRLAEEMLKLIMKEKA